jgi:hypothetical protein
VGGTRFAILSGMTRRLHPPLLALAALLAFGRPGPAQPPQTFSEQLVIREREIVVDLPDRLKGSRLSPRDFQVLVDGEPREVTRAEPVSKEGPAPWTVLVYVDRGMASHGTAFYSSLALAGHARELAGLGTVEVVVADPAPHPALPPTREAQKIEETLAGLADQDRIARDRSRTEAPPPPSDAQVRQQLDQLLAFLGTRHPAGPHALFLVADGSASAALEAPFRDASQRLAAAGWVGVSLALRQGDPGKPVSPRNEADIFQETTAWSNATNGPPPPPPARAPTKSALAFPRVVDLSLDPELAPLQKLASATAGTVIGYDVQLPALLAELPRRWTVWISEPEASGENRFHALRVRLPRKRAEVRAPLWLP